MDKRFLVDAEDLDFQKQRDDFSENEDSLSSGEPSSGENSEEDSAESEMDVEDQEDKASEVNESSSPSMDKNDVQKGRKPLDAAKLKKFQQEHDRSGVLYMSRVPPKMKPAKVRHLLSQFGQIGRIYLAQENPKIREKRIRAGGNRKRNFHEGWIEFQDKRIAKLVAASLNNTPMGGKKSNYYHDDLWNLKYLPKFKWIHLAQQLAYERQERAKKLQVEVSQAKAEMSLYLKNVDKAKMIQAMEDKRKAKASAAVESAPAEGQGDANSGRDLDAVRRRFRQRKAILTHEEDPSRNAGNGKHGKVQSVLGKILT